MKRETGRTHRIALPCALLTVVFLIGCQEQGPEIAGPLFKKEGGGKPGGTATVTLTGSMVGSETGVAITVNNNRKLQLPAPATVDWGLYPEAGATPSNGEYGDCRYDPPDADPATVQLLATSLASGTGQGGGMYVDKTSLGEPSEDNRVTVRATDDEVVGFVQIGHSGLFPELGAIVDPYTDVDGTIEYTISGGVVRAVSAGNPKNTVQLACPNVNAVVSVTLERN